MDEGATLAFTLTATASSGLPVAFNFPENYQRIFTEKDLITMMVGRELKNVYPKREVPIGDVVLRVENLTSGELLKGISFDVHKGEIFGIGGLVGSRRTETLEALFGMRPITDGKIFLNGEEFHPTNPRQAIQHKIAFVTEDRKKSGLVS